MKNNKFFYCVLITLIFLLFIIGSWNRYGHISGDLGRELNGAVSVAKDKNIYRDLFWFKGPLGIYINAYLLKLARRLEVIMLFYVIITEITICIFYLLCTFLLSPFFSFFTTLLYLVMYFIHPAQLLPYSSDSILSLDFSIWCFLLLFLYYKTNSNIYIILCSILTFLAILGKYSIGIVLFVVISLILLISSYTIKTGNKHRENSLFTYVLLVLISTTSIFILFASQAGIENLLWNLDSRWLLKQAFPKTYIHWLQVMFFQGNFTKQTITEACILWGLVISIILATIYLLFRRKNINAIFFFYLALYLYLIGYLLQSQYMIHFTSIVGFALIIIFHFLENTPFSCSKKLKIIFSIFIILISCYYGFRRFADYQRRNIEVITPYGGFYATPQEAHTISELRRYVEKYTKPAEKVVFLAPYDITCFVAGRELSRLIYHTYTWRYEQDKTKKTVEFLRQGLAEARLIVTETRKWEKEPNLQKIFTENFNLIKELFIEGGAYNIYIAKGRRVNINQQLEKVDK